MGEQTAQGTRWESRIVKGAGTSGRKARRLAKTGVKNEADVKIPGTNMRPAVAWERWVGKKGKGKRRAIRMVAITEAHYYELLTRDERAEYGYWIQCKSTQALSLSATMIGLETWIEENSK